MQDNFVYVNGHMNIFIELEEDLHEHFYTSLKNDSMNPKYYLLFLINLNHIVVYEDESELACMLVL